MGNVIKSRGYTVINSTVYHNGSALPPVPNSNSHFTNVTQINDKIYVNGYEWKNGKWKRTLKAWWHLWF